MPENVVFAYKVGSGVGSVADTLKLDSRSDDRWIIDFDGINFSALGAISVIGPNFIETDSFEQIPLRLTMHVLIRKFGILYNIYLLVTNTF